MQIRFQSIMPVNRQQPAQPRFGAGLVVREFSTANREVAEAIQSEAEFTKDKYSEETYSWGISIRPFDDETYMFNGQEGKIATAVRDATPAIYRITEARLGWGQEQTNKAIQKLYQRLCGETPLDWE